MAGFCSSPALAWESWAGWSNTEPAGVAGDLQAHGLKAKLEGVEKAERQAWGCVRKKAGGLSSC